MAYSNVWSDTAPTGAEAANTIDDIFRSLKVDVEQRLIDIFGTMPNFTDDPLRPYGLKFTDVQDSIINYGDNAGTPRNLVIKNKAGAITYFTFNQATLAIGTNPAAAGVLRIANGGVLTWRNAANSADVGCIGVDGSNQVVLGLTNTVAIVFTVISITPASTTASSGLRLPHGAAPTSPVNGDIWTTTAGLYARINGVTVGPFT